MTGSNVWIADKVKDDLTRVAKENNVTYEVDHCFQALFIRQEQS